MAPCAPFSSRRPFAHYARGRAEFPVFRHPGLPMISAFRYADIQPVLKDPECRWVDCCRRQLVKRYNLDDVMGGPPSYSLETF